MGIDRYSKWPVAQIRKSHKPKEVMKVLESFINFHGVPEKTKSDKGSAFISRENTMFCKNRKIEKEYSPPRLHTGTGAV